MALNSWQEVEVGKAKDFRETINNNGNNLIANDNMLLEQHNANVNEINSNKNKIGNYNLEEEGTISQKISGGKKVFVGTELEMRSIQTDTEKNLKEGDIWIEILP